MAHGEKTVLCRLLNVSLPAVRAALSGHIAGVLTRETAVRIRRTALLRGGVTVISRSHDCITVVDAPHRPDNEPINTY